MLAPTSDYGYVPSPAMGYDLHHLQSGERPKLFLQSPVTTVDSFGHMLGHHHHHHHHPHASSHSHHILTTPQNALTPQHALTPQNTMTQQNALTPQHALTQQQALTQQHAMTDTEPLLLNVPGGGHYYSPAAMAPPPLLHVSSDFEYAQGHVVVTPSSARSHCGAKRSREDLNLKEKKRMLKLNDRISQLKDMLDEAGVQTKKNKQSVLDNAAHYIEMLRSNLLIAKQKAERAEKQTEAFRQQQQQQQQQQQESPALALALAGGSADSVVRGVFQKSTTPRVVMDLTWQPLTFNEAFVRHTGLSALALKQQKTLRPFLCADQDALAGIMKTVCETKQSLSTVVQTAVDGGRDVAVTLVAAVVTDDAGKAANVEFSLVPVKTSQGTRGVAKRAREEGRQDGGELSAGESLTDGEPTDDSSRL